MFRALHSQFNIYIYVFIMLKNRFISGLRLVVLRCFYGGQMLNIARRSLVKEKQKLNENERHIKVFETILLLTLLQMIVYNVHSM